MNHKKLFKQARARIKCYGYVGLDFNMAVICIIAKRYKSYKVAFQCKDNYHEKLDYWARKRSFGEVHYGSEDEILQAANKHWNEEEQFPELI